MQNFNLNRDIAQLAVLQRIELLGNLQKRFRKIFGRYFFSVFLSKYFINPNEISKNYFNLMKTELTLIDKYINKNDRILSIGSGIGGLEILIHNKFNNHISFIEKNYISKKIKYGWDKKNKEAYNNLELLKKFLLNNGFKREKFNLFDFDKDSFPQEKFDLIISLYSLDYHYEFNLYKDYLDKVMKSGTILIFDTIRPDYFKNIFKNVEVIKQDFYTVHKSKRIICSN
tara:strand:+ start:50 stop:733 length:684 start_codon:yes stop_codon:yes gene_type:complete